MGPSAPAPTPSPAPPPPSANVYTYPVKSINLDAASSVSFYVAYGSTEQMGTVDDLHPVHGVQTTDGSYVIVGKAMESETSELMEAFAVCLNARGALKWAWRSGLRGSDAANAVAQVSPTEVVVVGWRTAQGSTTSSDNHTFGSRGPPGGG